MKGFTDIFILGLKLPYKTFGSNLPLSHPKPIYLFFFFLISFILQVAGVGGVENYTFHKCIWYIIKLWIVAMFRALSNVLSGKSVPWCSINIVTVVIGVPSV